MHTLFSAMEPRNYLSPSSNVSYTMLDTEGIIPTFKSFLALYGIKPLPCRQLLLNQIRDLVQIMVSNDK